jgi:hypothetical protein
MARTTLRTTSSMPTWPLATSRPWKPICRRTARWRGLIVGTILLSRTLATSRPWKPVHRRMARSRFSIGFISLRATLN